MHTSISYMKKKMAAASYFQHHSFPQIRNYTTHRQAIMLHLITAIFFYHNTVKITNDLIH